MQQCFLTAFWNLRNIVVFSYSINNIYSMDIDRYFSTRRTVRRYTAQEVDNDLLTRLIDEATCCAEVAAAESVHFGQGIELLSEQCCVDGGGHQHLHVVEASRKFKRDTRSSICRSKVSACDQRTVFRYTVLCRWWRPSASACC